ncbi:MAG: hypothetical protein QOH79_2586 [Acidimicrobiaceae bacterium]
MWGDGTGGWLPGGPAWLSILVAAAIPHTVTNNLSTSVDAGVVIVPDEMSWGGRVPDRCAVVTGPPPESIGEALACLRDAMGALVRPDLRGVLLPRVDDPGASSRRHLEGWRFDDVSTETWDALWRALEGFGTASVFCCPGWVEAGGRVVPSRRASPGEWRSLDEGVRRGVAELECHGYTHLHPDVPRWMAAPDRFTNEEWYRELRPPMDPGEPSVDAQAEVLDAWQRACGPGTSVVAPGEAWGLNTLAAARRLGFTFFNSWGLCHLQAAVPTWTSAIVSPYLDQPESDRVAAGLPVIAYWHDRDMAVHGPRWAPEWLEGWRTAGATRAWSFRQLAEVFRTPIDAALVGDDVVIGARPTVPLLIERP